MEVDHKGGSSSLASSGNPKKRSISFRLSIASKRAKLPYQQRTSASTYSTFYVEDDTTATPDTSSTLLAMDDDDPFFDNDAESSLPSFPNEAESLYSSHLDHDTFNSTPIFTSTGPNFDLNSNSESSSRFVRRPSTNVSAKEQAILDRLSKSYNKVETEDLFKDCPIWSAWLEAKRNGPSGTFSSTNILTMPFYLSSSSPPLLTYAHRLLAERSTTFSFSPPKSSCLCLPIMRLRFSLRYP